ncbi:hypothetical protein [Paraliomyxa miuraensis]|uniref:hypothetical protein n=1 Tax=Paraliomyxa miuraensis TaxID=376150 RepID=UPI0022598C66|nr:hypothetical protein [Paraliomyxa miuraensis]MCX4247401.1 hypothetical protein [Paraliomyxa miuraensis]
MRIHVHFSSIVVAASLALGLTACDDQDGGRPDPAEGGASEDPEQDAEPADDGAAQAEDPPPRVADEPLTTEQVRTYLARVAPVIAGRSLTYDESQMIADLGEDAIEPMISGWVGEPGFAEAIRYLIQEQLHASGEREGVDYELPGNLAAEIARDGLPWSTILTADYCVDAAGEHIDCDTGAPYAAGVLATRAYLISNKGRFNLSRAKLMLETFACRVYPMEQAIQIPLQKPVLIPMFRAESAEEQVVEEAQGGFGNGNGCYTCHSQFSAHAQPFVKFDADGIWREEATGQQDPYGELGRSFDGLYASHLFDPYEAADEATQIFGQRVANLREAGEVIADSELFPQCTVKNLVAHAFDLKAGASDDISKELVTSVAARITSTDDDPSIADYVVEVFTNEQVIDAVVASQLDQGLGE